MTGMHHLSSLHSDMQRTAAKQREAAQAAPRPSRVRFTVRTTGVGESRLIGRKALSFGAYMLDEPSFSFGVVALSPLQGGELPQATAVVLRWIKNGNGMYTGAEVGFKIGSTKQDIRLEFSLTFEAVTLRTTAGTGTSTTDAPHGQNFYQGTDQQASGTDSSDPARFQP